MDRGQMVLVTCTIEAGAFSGERIFRLKLADGQDYSGVAPVGYCLDHEKKSLGRDRPETDRPIEGFIVAYLVANGGDQAIVELPNGEAVKVPVSLIPYRQDRDREARYVPLGS